MPEGESRTEPPEGPKVRKVLRKKKKRHLSSCERTCMVCRAPCDNPFHPEHVVKGRSGK